MPGGCYFFTVVCWSRRPVFNTPEPVDLLRKAMRTVKQSRPFDIEAMVVLPDHLHCIWRLPETDDDFSGRWREIKKYLTRRLTRHPGGNGTPVWQPRFWEHSIRDDEDMQRHMDYVHYNPVKHGLVSAPVDWPYSSFHAAVRRGLYSRDWGSACPEAIRLMDFE
jgi:putative transposase